MNDIRKLKKQLREAVANYIGSEGCSCCEGSDHSDHEKAIAKLLNVPMYEDKSGFNFKKFETKP